MLAQLLGDSLSRENAPVRRPQDLAITLIAVARATWLAMDLTAVACLEQLEAVAAEVVALHDGIVAGLRQRHARAA